MKAHAPLLSMLLLLAACGGSTPDVAEPDDAEPPAVSALDHLPPTTFAILRIDAAALRASPYRDILDGWVRELAQQLQGTRFAALDVVSLVDATDEVVIGFSTPGGDDVEVVAILRGRYQAAALQASIAALRDEAGNPMFLPKQRGGHDVLVRTGEGEVTVLDDGTVLAGSEGHVAPMLERHAGRPDGSPLAEPAARAIAERVDLATAPAAAVVRVNELIVNELTGSDIPVRSVDAIGMRLDLAAGLDLRAIFATHDVAAASTIASQIEGQVARARNEAMIAMMGFGPFLAGTSAHVEGTDAIVETRAQENDVRNLLGRLSAFVPAMLASLVEELD